MASRHHDAAVSPSKDVVLSPEPSHALDLQELLYAEPTDFVGQLLKDSPFAYGVLTCEEQDHPDAVTSYPLYLAVHPHKGALVVSHTDGHLPLEALVQEVADSRRFVGARRATLQALLQTHGLLGQDQSLELGLALFAYGHKRLDFEALGSDDAMVCFGEEDLADLAPRFEQMLEAQGAHGSTTGVAMGGELWEAFQESGAWWTWQDEEEMDWEEDPC